MTIEESRIVYDTDGEAWGLTGRQTEAVEMANIIVDRSEGDRRLWFAKVTSGPHRNHPFFMQEHEWFGTKKAAMEWARQEAARQDAIQASLSRSIFDIPLD